MSALAAALDKLESLDLEALTHSTIRALVIGYAETYFDEQWQAVAVESEFRLPILNPDAERLSSSRTYDHAGKLDLVVESPSRPGYYLMDHKTTSEDISPGNDFWKRLFLATQPSHYQFACWQAGIELAGCVWDVIRKPSIRPRKVTKAEREELANGTYQGIALRYEYRGEETETPYLYGLRVLADIRHQPDKYFQRQIVPRSKHEMLEFARDLFGTASLIRRSTSEGKFYRTGATHACMMYGKSCEYLDLCCGFSNEGDGRYVQIPVHDELSFVDDSNSILTNSSLTVYRQCQRKYEYRYVKQIGLAKSHDESLYFGSAMHSVLEAYWKQLLAPETRRLGRLFERSTDGNGSTERAGGETANGSTVEVFP